MSQEDELNATFLQKLQTALTAKGCQVEISSQYAALKIDGELEVASGVLPGDFHPSLAPFIVYTIHNDWFPEGIEENIVGIGESVSQKADRAVETYAKFIFPAIQESLADSHEEALDFSTESNGKKILWHPKPGGNVFQGEWDPSDPADSLYDLVSEEVIGNLENRKINWLKLYVARQPDGTIACDSLLNNKPWSPGVSLLNHYASNWPEKESFQSQKQLVMFRQCDGSPG